MSVDKNIMLPGSEMPRKWYNIAADLPAPLPPPLNPATNEPIGPDALAPIFPENLIMQEVSTERWIDIPEEVLEILSIWRPSPLVRATRLEQYLDTPAKIYYKNESVSPPGSHKPNTAVAQAFYNKEAGIKRLTTETGAGQWGSALAFATQFFGIECSVFMVKISYNQKPYRRILMNTWGADVTPSPSDKTKAGRDILAKDPECLGSLGIAISEAIEMAVQDEKTKYSLGSVLNHVLIHQTVIGLEAQKQLAMVGDEPDVIIGCVGGGSNYAGIAFPFIPQKLEGKRDIKFIAVEPKACPTMTKGPYKYDFGDTAMTTPLMKMHSLGHDFVPAGIHAGGLRYHGMAPLVSLLAEQNVIEARSYYQKGCFEAAVMFARTEGLVCAPETSHAIRAVIDEALRCKEEGKEEVILFNYSGHGLIDLAAYDAYFSDHLEDIDHEIECPEY
jgi:tryptophan synthase beta chain